MWKFLTYDAFLEQPLSLQSCCRLLIRKQLGPHRLPQIKHLGIKDVETEEMYGLAPNIVDFLEYRELFLSVGQLPESDLWSNSSHSSAIKQLGKVIREVRKSFSGSTLIFNSTIYYLLCLSLQTVLSGLLFHINSIT